MNEQTPFRIGGIYRDGADRIVRLSLNADTGMASAEAFDGRKWLGYMNCFRLADGKWMGNPDGKESLHLLPGECNEQGEPIAPTFYCAAETIKAKACCCGEPEASGRCASHRWPLLSRRVARGGHHLASRSHMGQQQALRRFRRIQGHSRHRHP